MSQVMFVPDTAAVEALFPHSYRDADRHVGEFEVSLFDKPWPDALETDPRSLA